MTIQVIIATHENKLNNEAAPESIISMTGYMFHYLVVYNFK